MPFSQENDAPSTQQLEKLDLIENIIPLGKRTIFKNLNEIFYRGLYRYGIFREAKTTKIRRTENTEQSCERLCPP